MLVNIIKLYCTTSFVPGCICFRVRVGTRVCFCVCSCAYYCVSIFSMIGIGIVNVIVWCSFYLRELVRDCN